jgi:predicted RNA-binding Zn-ribbon protein involved in translation (DUF1610 family)
MTPSSYNTKIRRYKLKTEAVRLKGGKCEKCGWQGNQAAFQFHHIDPTSKSFTISQAVTTNWEKYWGEVKKCELLCANCHMILHSDNTSEQFLKDVNSYNGRELIESDIPWKNKNHVAAPKVYNHTCPTCKSAYQTKTFQQKYCSFECRNNGMRRCKRPSKNKLSKLISEFPFTYIGKQYGVSDNAVRKWCKIYKLI